MTAAKLFRENSIRLIQKRTIVQGREIGEFGVTDCINNKISVSLFQKCNVLSLQNSNNTQPHGIWTLNIPLNMKFVPMPSEISIKVFFNSFKH